MDLERSCICKIGLDNHLSNVYCGHMTTDPGPARVARLQPGDPIDWVTITGDGNEYLRTGRVWSPAPAVPRAGRAWWVIADGDSSGRAFLIVQAGRRHRVGRDRNGTWRANGGRFVDKGERYREADRRSLIERTRAERIAQVPPRSISSEPTTTAARTEYDNYLRTIEQYEQRTGE